MEPREIPLYRAPGHSDYLLKGKEIEVLWTDVCPNWSDEEARFVHENFRIPFSTVYFWRRKWSQNYEWRPTQTAVQGLHHRILAMADFIPENDVVPGKLFTNEDCKEMTLHAFKEKYRAAEEMPALTASSGFIQSLNSVTRFAPGGSTLKDGRRETLPFRSSFASACFAC